MRRLPPERIVCPTEETVETLYLLGEDARIAGVSSYAVRPPRVRREKPSVSASTSADPPKVRARAPPRQRGRPRRAPAPAVSGRGHRLPSLYRPPTLGEDTAKAKRLVFGR